MFAWRFFCLKVSATTEIYPYLHTFSLHDALPISHKRTTYTQVWNAVGDGVPGADREQARAVIGDQLPQVERLHQFYQVLDKARRQRGAIDFETSEVRF